MDYEIINLTPKLDFYKLHPNYKRTYHMKTLKIFASVLLTGFLISTVAYAGGDKVKEKFKVLGNCGMCNTKIVTAAKSVDGVISAKWSSETEIMVVKFHSEKTNVDEIQKKIASVGYDTEKHKADDETYANLHQCCKYDRE